MTSTASGVREHEEAGQSMKDDLFPGFQKVDLGNRLGDVREV